jgi:hypothetical protein
VAGPIRISILANASQAKRELNGFADSTSSKFKKFGKVAAAGLAVAAVALAKFGADSVKSASDMQETVSKTETVFGKQADAVKKWGETTASAFGISSREALDGASTFGNFFDQIGIGQRRSAEMSKTWVEMSADLASFHNAAPVEVMESLASATRGEYDALQKFIPTVNAASVEQKALAMTGKDSADSLTNAEKAAATYALTLRDQGKAAGDFARTSGSLANQTRMLTAQWEDFKIKVGNALIPILTRLVGYITGTVIPTLERWWDKLAPAREAIAKVASAVGTIIGLIRGGKWEQAWGTFKTASNKALNTVGTNVRNFATDRLIPAIGRALARAHDRWAKGWENWWKDPEKSYDETLSATDRFGVRLRETAAKYGVQALVAFQRSIRGFPKAAAKIAVDTIHAMQTAWRGAPGLARHVAVDIAGNFISGLRAMPGAARSIAVSTVANLLGGFSNLGGIMSGIGARIISSLISGIDSMIGPLRDRFQSITNMIPDWKGPKAKDKRLLRPTGRWIMQGLVAGIKDGQRGVEKVLGQLTKQIEKALNRRYDGKQLKRMTQAWAKWLRRADDALIRNAKAQDRNTERTKKAREALRDLIKESKEYAKAIAASVVGTGNITGLGKQEDGTTSITTLLNELRDKVAAAKRYASLVASLTKQGLNKTTIQQIIDAGVEGGLATAEALASGGQAAISEVNSLTAELRATGKGLGDSVASTMYDAGIKAAKGLIRGLEKQGRALDRAAVRLANSLVRAVKKALGIKSPSRVFEGLGTDVTKGLVIGLDETYVKRAGASLATSLKSGFGTPALDAYSASVASSSQQTIAVTLTAEQVSALQRGREIQMDLDAFKAAGGRVRA